MVIVWFRWTPVGSRSDSEVCGLDGVKSEVCGVWMESGVRFAGFGWSQE